MMFVDFRNGFAQPKFERSEKRRARANVIVSVDGCLFQLCRCIMNYGFPCCRIS